MIPRSWVNPGEVPRPCGKCGEDSYGCPKRTRKADVRCHRCYEYGFNAGLAGWVFDQARDDFEKINGTKETDAEMVEAMLKPIESANHCVRAALKASRLARDVVTAEMHVAQAKRAMKWAAHLQKELAEMLKGVPDRLEVVAARGPLRLLNGGLE